MKTLTPSAPSSAVSKNGSAPPKAKARRRFPPALVGIGLGVLSLGIFVFLTPQGIRSSRVLVVARPVAAGATITTSDLKIMALAVPKGLAVVPAAAEASVVNQVAETDLVPGALLVPDDLGPASASASVVGVALKAGQYPPGLSAGQLVEVVVTPPTASTIGATGLVPGAVLAPAAVVQSIIQSASEPGNVMVGLGVAGPEALAITQAGATGQVALVVEP